MKSSQLSSNTNLRQTIFYSAIFLSLGLTATIACTGQVAPVPFDLRKHSWTLSQEKAAITSDQTRKFSILLRHGRLENIRELLSTNLEKDVLANGWSRGRTALYLSVCESLLGNEKAAQNWARASRLEGIPELDTSPIPIEFESLWLPNQDHETAFVSIETVARNNMPLEASMDHSRSMKKTLEEVGSRLRMQSEKEGTEAWGIRERVDLATWLLLCGEMAGKYEELAMWTSSVDTIQLGQQLLEDIEFDIQMDPSLEDQISQKPDLAIRLDLARLRMTNLVKTAELSREAERSRLNQLREISRAYRQAVDLLSVAYFHVLADDRENAEKSIDEVLANIKGIYELASQRNDWYLFHDEPVLADAKSDLELLTSRPTIASAGGISFLKAIKAYQLLKQGANQPDSDLLAQVEKLAQDALSGEAPLIEQPGGDADENNPLARYVLGLVEELRGDGMALRGTLEDWKQASVHYRNAFDFLVSVVERLEEEKDVISGFLVNDSIDRAARISDPMPALEVAAALVEAGDYPEAIKTLTDAVKRNANSDLGLSLLDLQRRSGASSEVVNDTLALLEEIGALDPATEIGAYARLSAAVFSAVELVSQKRIDPDLAGRMLQYVDQLRSLDSGDGAILSHRGRADASLALALAPMLSEMVVDPAKGAEAYRVAADMNSELASLKNSDASYWERLGRIEALVYCRLAMGHLATQTLPDYRDESVLAFSAAADAAGQGITSQHCLAAVGSPLLESISKRSAQSDQILAAEERQRRIMMSKFVEASFAGLSGLPDQAADEMERAVRETEASPGSEEVSLDAGLLLAASDGFEAFVSLPSQIRAFQILSRIQAGNFDQALIDAAHLATTEQWDHVPFDQSDVGRLQQAVDSIQDPVQSFAIAKALVKKVEVTSLGQGSFDRNGFIDLAKKLFARTQTLSESSRLMARYQAIRETAAHELAWIENPELRVQKIEDLIKHKQWEDAIVETEIGCRFFADSIPLWNHRLALASVLVDKGIKSPDDIRGLAEELETLAGTGVVPLFWASLQTAKSLELRNPDRETNFRRAIETADTSPQRVLSLSESALHQIELLSAEGVE